MASGKSPHWGDCGEEINLRKLLLEGGGGGGGGGMFPRKYGEGSPATILMGHFPRIQVVHRNYLNPTLGRPCQISKEM